MKKIHLTYKVLMLLFCSFLAASCSNDDDGDEEVPLSNQLEYDATIYDLTLGATVDFGEFGLSTTPTHYGQVFLVTDASATGGEKVNLIFLMGSLGTSRFNTGKFEYANLAGRTPTQQEAAYGKKNFFFESVFMIDLNNDDELDPNTETVNITGGTATISGSAPEYTLDCDVQLENGKRVRAQFTGDFIEIQPDDDLDGAAAKDLKIAPTPFPFKVDRFKNFKRN